VLPFSARTRTANLTRMAEDRFDVLVGLRSAAGISAVDVCDAPPRRYGPIIAPPMPTTMYYKI